MRLLQLLALVSLAGCVDGFDTPRPTPQPVFDPIAFFAGHTEGRGHLAIMLRSPAGFAVHGNGRILPDGSLILDQTVERSGHKPEQRQWHMRRTGAGHYSATLSSAEGPVSVAVDGNVLRLDFRQNGLRIHQDILLAPDGRSALNRMTLHKLGLRMAAIEERIEKGTE